MRAHKPAGTFRIFVLGEFGGDGNPEPAYGAWRYLEALLRERFPEQSFEYRQCPFTPSTRTPFCPLRQECAGLDGDLWIVYMGNNEMVGPFGAVTVFGAKAPPLWMVRLGLAIQRHAWDSWQRPTGHWLKGKRAVQWDGMRMFAAERVGPLDPKRESVYANFRGNLRES